MKTNSHINIYPQICMLKIDRINDRNDTLEQHSKFSQIQLISLKKKNTQLNGTMPPTAKIL